jgi:hypothetical protein
VQAGGLGMVALGLAQLIAVRLAPGHRDNTGFAALWLCVIGLVGVFLVGYPGYFVFDAIWPSFYYSPIAAGKNAWLLWQAFFIGVYFVGAVLMFNMVRRSLNAIPVSAQLRRTCLLLTQSGHRTQTFATSTIITEKLLSRGRG